MIKKIDIDALFEKYIKDYVYKSVGKVKPEEIEDNIPLLYNKFGDESLTELDGKTPKTYYSDFSVSELLDCLNSHIENGVPVSDFLCEAITKNVTAGAEIGKRLNSENSEEFTLYLLNMLGEVNSEFPALRLLEFVLYDYSEPVRELSTELLCTVCETVKENILSIFKETPEERKSNLTEILSYCKKDDRVFDVLTLEFAKNQNNIPLYASYLSRYGDERALPFLLTAIENEKINYSDFEELRFAIESLGGEYTKERDFSKDRYIKKIKENNSQNS